MMDDDTRQQLEELAEGIVALWRAKEAIDSVIGNLKQSGYRVLEESGVTRDMLPKKGGDDQELADLVYGHWW